MGCDAFWRSATRLLGSAVGIMLLAIPVSGKLSHVIGGNSPLVWALSAVLSLGAVAYAAGFAWLALSAAIRRCHDLNQSPWILLAGLTIVALPVLPIYLAAAHGAGPLPASGSSEAGVCSFDGRIGRACYWRRSLAPFLLLVGLSMVTYLIPGDSLTSAAEAPPSHGVLVALALACVGALPVSLGVLAAVLLVAALAWAAIAAGVKRCHDLGCSGWLVLLQFIPFLGLVMVLWLGCAPGREPVAAEAPPPAPL
jgi:uncharacterized membrane protein YhaH (DUF805 family)